MRLSWTLERLPPPLRSGLTTTETLHWIGLIRRQVVETSTLRNWTPLRSRLAPIPFKSGLLFGGEILQQADCLDKEEEQLKKARSFGSRRGYLRSIFKGQTRGRSSSQSTAPRPAPTSNQQQSITRGGRRARSRSRSRSRSRGRGRSQSCNRSRVSFKEPPSPRRYPPFPSRYLRGGGGRE